MTRIKPLSLVAQGMFFLMAFGLLASAASAMSIRELRGLERSDQKQGVVYVQYYLVGVMEGILEGHDQSVRKGAQSTLCLNGRRLEPRMAKLIYDGELKRNKDSYEADMPVQLVMLNALSTAYTCS